MRRPASVTAALNIDRSTTLSGGAGSHRTLGTPWHPWVADRPPHAMCPRDPKGGRAVVNHGVGQRASPLRACDELSNCSG